MARKGGTASNGADRNIGHPVFGEAEPTPDPAQFKIHHPSDGPAYTEIDKLNKLHQIQPMPFPAARSRC